MGRSIETRIKQHNCCFKSGYISSSAVAGHYSETGHNILFKETSVIAKYPNSHGRKIKQVIEIHKLPDNINREDGYYLSIIWKPLLQAPLSSSQLTDQE
ncbi:hypothetical protein Trydic_g1738 [Trypoxylus dichotomus]